MSGRWIHPDDRDQDVEFDVYFHEDDCVSYQEYWQSYVDSANDGDTESMAYLFAELVRFLEGTQGQLANAVIESPAARHLLASRIKAGLVVKAKDVGKAMGLDLPTNSTRKSKYASLKSELISWYMTQMQDLGLSSRDELPLKDVMGWLKSSSHDLASEVEERTVYDWTQEARKRLYDLEILKLFKT